MTRPWMQVSPNIEQDPGRGAYMLKHIYLGQHRGWCGFQDVILHMSTEQLADHVAELTRLLEEARALDVREALAEAKLAEGVCEAAQ